MHRSAQSISPFVLAVLVMIVASVSTSEGIAWQWVPSDEEILRYRQSWNPFSHGPILISAVDIQPKGQLHLRPFIFSQIGERSFGNRFALSTESRGGPIHLYSVQHPFLQTAYGLTDHIEIGGATSLNTFWARDSDSFNRGQGGPVKVNTGIGDTSLIVKYRPIIQAPDTRRPSVTFFTQLVLPTGRWLTATERPPGGFSPLGRFPGTRAGEIGFSEGILFRKNLRPFRISGGVFYTYAAPGSVGEQTTYYGDVVNTRLTFEHILDDQRGFGYNIELVSLHGLTWRADGHAVNAGQQSGFSVLGIEPALQWRFGRSNFVGAAGVLFTVAGQNALDSIYPNFSLFWYWSQSGKVIMR
jgi:hypothetical protein